ncbi:MAG: HPr family phosphocarrier protein [Hungatella sp.]|nr:HPr family phosphocarrier protein [Hungatella sp.]
MLRRVMDIRQRYHPIPLTVLITTANSCDCDIFIEYEASRVNVKDYEAMIQGFDTHSQTQLFLFNGIDEENAEQRIERLFAP